MKSDLGNGMYDIDYNDGAQETCVPAEMICLLNDPGHGGEKAIVGHADAVQLLLSAGANLEAADKVILMIHYCMTV